ncbi:MAG TPA: glutathione S-transferase C-terminal domain-containing protein [Solirubrobacteraceae bacterium]|jgi:putative glutathione S-transferase|nr:glutathione S-transferase C-terminal domain-containing protein [Solirubrobacteraceae bacterium]
MSTPKLDTGLAPGAMSAARFERPTSRFRDWVSDDRSTPYPAAPGRYHLYVSWACPWAHRTVIGRRLKGLEDVIGMSVVDPLRDERGWEFTGGEYVDPVNGFRFLGEAYEITEPGYEGRFSVPVLWDTETGRIVNNESADVLRMFSTGFGDLAGDEHDLYPERHRHEIDELNKRIYQRVNDAVYQAGFTRDQEVYESVVYRLFDTLDELDARLANQRFLFGDAPVETDWRLFTTLVRFDPVYAVHFKCTLRRLVEYPNLWPYTRDLYQQPGIADTVRLDEIRNHYYRTHAGVNPSGLVAVLPDADLTAPHGREALGG